MASLLPLPAKLPEQQQALFNLPRLAWHLSPAWSILDPRAHLRRAQGLQTTQSHTSLSAGFSDPLGIKTDLLVSTFPFTAVQSPIKSISIKISHATSIAVPRNDTFPLRTPAFLNVPSHKFPKHMRTPEAA
ncbi:hypothetical protein MHYP_G00146830 [Metynnis hypsauchen]